MGIFQRTKDTKQMRETQSAYMPTFYPINVEDLQLAPYQRGLRQHRVKAYVDGYDKDIFGIILVSHRNGRYWVIDGQHRVAVAKTLGINTVWCQVIEGLTYEEEADKFYKINDSKARLNANHKFHALVEKKETWAIEIVDSLKMFGFKYSKEGNDHSDNCINCVGSLKQIHKNQKNEGLRMLLSVLRRAWNGDHSSLQAEIIKGLNTFLVNYNCNVDFLIKVLETDTPKGISDRARAYTQNIRRPGDGACFHIARTIRDMYDDMAIRTKGAIPLCSVKVGE